MKNTKHTSVHIIIASALLFITVACENLFDNPLKHKETGENIALLLVDPYVFDTQLTLHFIDEETGLPVNDHEIIFAFAGNDAQYIVDAGGTHRAFSLTETGVAELFLDPNRTPSESAPLELTLFCDDPEYFFDAYPVSIKHNTTGQHSIIVNMIRTNNSVTNNAPFEMLYNDSIINNDTPNWNILSKTIQQNGKTYYRIYRTNDPIEGYLSLSNPAQSYQAWGIEGYLANENEEYSIIELNHQASGLPANHLQFKAYMATYNQQFTECLNGINITIKNTNNSNGTASFYYQILSETNILKEGFLSTSEMPNVVNTGSFYYPTESTNLTFTVFDNEQYEIADNTYNLNGDLCQKAIELNASPKPGLEPYNVAISFYCKDDFMGIAPSASGSYKEKDSNKPYTRFSFTQGVSTLYLKPGKTYNIEATIIGQDMSFDFPTNPENISEIIENASYQNIEIEYIDYEINENDKGLKNIKIKVYFKEEKCPF